MKSAITYYYDGSCTQGKGTTTNHCFYHFLTFRISSETNTTLSALKVTVLQLLVICGDVKPDDLWSWIDFVSHNIEV